MLTTLGKVTVSCVNKSRMMMNCFVVHCVKCVRIWSYSGPHFPAFGLNTDTFHAVLRLAETCKPRQDVTSVRL